MTIRVILATLTGGDTDRAVLDQALAVARLGNAHVRALHVKDSTSAALLFAAPESFALSAEVIEAAEREIDARAATARAHFDAWQKANGVPLAEHPRTPGEITAQWHEETGSIDGAVAHHGRVSDLIVVCRQALAGGPPSADFDAALFSTGRPVLLVPIGPTRPLLQTAVIAWNGSLEASRALGLALPLLERCETVRVFSLDENDLVPKAPRDFLAYLSWHAIPAEMLRVSTAGDTVGARLLADCRAAEASLLVMGGYTHSRIREMVFGGVTRAILEKADFPVLLAH